MIQAFERVGIRIVSLSAAEELKAMGLKDRYTLFRDAGKAIKNKQTGDFFEKHGIKVTGKRFGRVASFFKSIYVRFSRALTKFIGATKAEIDNRVEATVPKISEAISSGLSERTPEEIQLFLDFQEGLQDPAQAKKVINAIVKNTDEAYDALDPKIRDIAELFAEELKDSTQGLNPKDVKTVVGAMITAVQKAMTEIKPELEAAKRKAAES